MRFNTKKLGLFLAFSIAAGVFTSCSFGTSEKDSNSSQTENIVSVSTESSSNPAPISTPTPTPEPYLAKAVAYFDPLVVGPNNSSQLDYFDRKSEDLPVILEEYDEHGNMIHREEAQRIYSPPAPYTGYNVDDYIYDDAGHCISHSKSWKTLQKTEDISITVYEYDEKGHLIHEETTSYVSNDSEIIEYFYDKGQLLREERTSITKESGYEVSVSYYTTYTYDDQGLLIEKTEYESKYSGELLVESYNYEYDSNGLMTKEEHLTVYNELIHTKMDYTDDGMLAKETCDRANVNFPVDYIYEYNDKSLVCTKTILNEKASNGPDGKFYSIEHQIYSYNEENMLESIQYYYYWGPSSRNVEDIITEEFADGVLLYKYYYE